MNLHKEHVTELARAFAMKNGLAWCEPVDVKFQGIITRCGNPFWTVLTQKGKDGKGTCLFVNDKTGTVSVGRLRVDAPPNQLFVAQE